MSWNRRSVVVALAAFFTLMSRRGQAALDSLRTGFVEQAFAMKRQAIAAGDQPYGAVIVQGDKVIGLGPSRVVVKNDGTAHAEREAIRDAQARLGRKDLSGCVMYSTSRPCSNCEQAAAQARVSRMYFGENAADAGVPGGRQ